MLGPGSSVTPTIRLVRQLGAGGMGAVWVADHLALQTQVVVKFMHPDLARDEGSLARFSREAVSASNVKSPHVVQILDHGVAEGTVPFIVMEMLEGCDLSTYLQAHGALPLPQVDLIISQTCKALARAHERGIVHRDIKPENIFLCSVGDGELFVKVLDFGIAKSQGVGSMSATKTGSLLGTPYYMSPEQTIGAKAIDARADLWSLGVVTYECMTGRRPFEAETVGGLAVAICNGPTPTPSLSLGAGHPLAQDLDAWFLRACARDPAQRFASAKEMADSLHAIVTGRVSIARVSVDNTLPLPLDTSNRTVPLAATGGRPALSYNRVSTNSPVSQTEEPVGVPKHGIGVGAVVAVLLASILLAAGVTAVVMSMGRPEKDGRAQAALPSTPSAVPTPSPPPPVLPALTTASASASTAAIPSPRPDDHVARGPAPRPRASVPQAASASAAPRTSAPAGVVKPPNDRNSID